MTEQYDFKGALDGFEKIKNIFMLEHLKTAVWSITHIKEILIALRLADRLQSGDVSDGMFIEAFNSIPFFKEGGVDDTEAFSYIFKAMSKQMIKEIK